MFDFLSYVRDSGLEVRILPPKEGILIVLELSDPEHKFYERKEITDREAASCGNIDIYTGGVLDGMAVRIMRRMADECAARNDSQKRRDMENFFRGK